MSKFIQVNKMCYSPHPDFSDNVYLLSEVDTIINTDYILQLTPRDTNERTNRMFLNVDACHVIMSNGDIFYVHGSFDHNKEKLLK